MPNSCSTSSIPGVYSEICVQSFSEVIKTINQSSTIGPFAVVYSPISFISSTGIRTTSLFSRAKTTCESTRETFVAACSCGAAISARVFTVSLTFRVEPSAGLRSHQNGFQVRRLACGVSGRAFETIGTVSGCVGSLSEAIDWLVEASERFLEPLTGLRKP